VTYVALLLLYPHLGLFNGTFQLEYLSGIYGSIFNIFLSSIYHEMEKLPGLKPGEIEPYISILEQVRESGLVAQFDVDIRARLSDVEERARQVTAEWYDYKLQEKHNEPGVNRALPMLFMTDEIEKAAKLLDKRFPQPLLECATILLFLYPH
jgi:hypothetical protein